MTKVIPNTIHFIFGLKKDFGGKPFSLVNYLAVRSAFEANKPTEIKFHYKYEPKGVWWEKSKKYLTLVKVEPPKSIFGRSLLNFAHQADVVRLDILKREGGIYLDMDVVSLKSFKPLLKYDFVMGVQAGRGLCNAVILAKSDSQFLKIWYESYKTFRGKNLNEWWDEHSVVKPMELAKKYPKLIHVENEFSFFWPPYDKPEILWNKIEKGHNTGLKSKFKNWMTLKKLNRGYCIHLWQTLWWDRYLKNLVPDRMKSGDNNFSKLFKRFFS